MHWYQRLAHIHAVHYASNPAVQRVQLPGWDLQPATQRFHDDGHSRESLWWSYRDGTASSASPATTWAAAAPPKDAAPAALLHHLYEVLELPGEAADYHFGIQGCVARLWGLRRTYPQVSQEIEQLCWLDIRLLEALPDTLRYQQSDGTFLYARSSAFERLIQLYERNGYLAEALDVAQRATRFHADDTTLQTLRERLARLEAEQ